MMDSTFPQTSFARPRARRSRRGIGLVDLALYSVVVVIVLTGVFFAVNTIRDGMRSMNMTKQAAMLVTTVDQVYGSFAAIDAGDLLPVIEATENFPASELNNGVMLSPWNTAVTVTGLGDRNYRVAVADLPSNGCRALLEAFVEGIRDPALVTVEGQAAEMTAGGIVQACSGEDGNQYDVELDF